MSSKPPEFHTPYEVTRPTPFQHLNALTPTGEPNDDGVLPQGEIVWTHQVLPKANGHHTALAFTDRAGEILVDIRALKLKQGTKDSDPHGGRPPA